MAHFIFSVAVVLLWLVAWGIYLVFGKSLKGEMEGIENSDPNQISRVWEELKRRDGRDRKF
ncbi:hypothetical protein CV729_07145 [Helicobacter pylori]|nr:hypothetical protein [Helicobacter pylori]QDY62805.1 hypothetical protein CV729_07145 [Helicobacter pylori]